MSGVFQNIDPPPPSLPGECVPLAIGAGGGHTRWAERGWGVNSLEDARHWSVLCLCKYFKAIQSGQASWLSGQVWKSLGSLLSFII
jgi:hypothetical protein